MEEPSAWVVGAPAERGTTACRDNNGVTAHGILLALDQRRVLHRVIGFRVHNLIDDLELVLGDISIEVSLDQ